MRSKKTRKEQRRKGREKVDGEDEEERGGRREGRNRREAAENNKGRQKISSGVNVKQKCTAAQTTRVTPLTLQTKKRS